jgi:transposase
MKPAYGKAGKVATTTEGDCNMNATMTEHDAVRFYWVGIDVAKMTFEVALAKPGQYFPATALRELPAATFTRSRDGAAQCVAWIERQIGCCAESARAVMEATGRYSQELALWLAASCPKLAPAIVNPAHTCAFIQSLGMRNKTDRLEARALAFYGMERRPAPHSPLEPAWAQLRELSRFRDSLVRAHVAQSNQAKEGTVCLKVGKMQARRLRQIERDIKKIEGEMRKLVAATPALKHDVDLLESILGVGFLTATVILSELGDLRRFDRARQLTAFAGLSPRIRKSGTSVDLRPHLCKQGNPRIRQALYMAALVVIRKTNHLRTMYDRLRSEGKSCMAALGAVMRKLLTVMRAVLLSGKPFEPNFKRISCGGQQCE